MRVLHIDGGRQLRGGQWQVVFLLEGLAAAGHAVTLLAPAGSPLYGLAQQKGIEVRSLGLAGVAGLSRRVQLTHVHEARAHTWAALAARGPVVVSRRVAFPPGRSALSRWKYGRAAHYLAVSEHVRGVLAAAGIAAARISVVYDGVPLPERRGEGDWVVAPATDDPRKGTVLLERAAAQAGLRIRFSRNLAEDLPQAAAFAYITHSEGLGSAVLLAMAHGLPVVASRTGGLPEIVEEGRTGLLVENTPQAIAAALERLRADREFARELGARGRRVVEEKFSVAAMVRNTLEVYRRVLAC